MFFEKNKEFLSVEDILIADHNADISLLKDDAKILNLQPIDKATSGDLTFFTTSLVSGDKYIEPLKHTKASYCLINKKFEKFVPNGVFPIFSAEPHITFMKLCEIFFIEKQVNKNGNIASSSNIGKFTSISPTAQIGENVVIEDFVKIGEGVIIGDNSIIKSSVTIGNNCIIGKNCILRENCSIKFSTIGDDCIIYSGVRIGEDGFGFVFDKRSMRQFKINHYGFVKIGNRVEIGANSCIDRGTFDGTIIEDDVKIDNLVQIGHNVRIGQNSVLAGQTGIAGSAKIGAFCMLGGKSGMAGHITLGNQCILYGATNISKSFPDGSRVIGTPGEKYKDWVKHYALLQGFMDKIVKGDEKKTKKRSPVRKIRDKILKRKLLKI